MLQDKSKALEQMIIVVIFTTFMGQIYISPFNSEFRLTLAVVVLNVLLLTFLDLKALLTINIVGVITFFFRSVIYTVNYEVGFYEAMRIYYPVVFFYIFYGLFFELFNVREKLRKPLSLFISLWICDSIPNIIEIMIRQEWQNNRFENMVLTIIAIGLIRTFLTIVLIYISNLYYDLFKRRQSYQKFKERIVMYSTLKTELFFLRKSKKDIENAMHRSFEVYEALDDDYLKEAILEVTKDIHEIKKDYTRVIAGIEKTIEETSSGQMPLNEVLSIAIETNRKLAEKQQKHIKFRQVIQFRGKTDAYYLLLSIINNLLANAIEAIENEGTIQIELKSEGSQIVIVVIDSGAGISSEDMDLIFEPGYSTKYNEVNGIMASGIGLTHVRYLVKDVMNGEIEVDSQRHKGTLFTIHLPKSSVLIDHVQTELNK